MLAMQLSAVVFEGIIIKLAGYSSSQRFLYLPFTVYHLPSLPMRRAIYPGSFDPVTNGHLDIIERGCKLFDEIIIFILVNPDKQPFFSIEERREIDRKSTRLNSSH